MTEAGDITLALVIGDPLGGRDAARRSPAGRFEGWTEVVTVGHAPRYFAGGADVPPEPGMRRPTPVESWAQTTADYLVFIPADCRLAADAHAAIHEMIRHNPSVDFAYFDSSGYDLSDPGRLAEPCHRPGYSPERLRAQMYLGEVFMVSRSVADATTTAEIEPDAIAAPLTHEAAMALTAASATIGHIPRSLYRTPEGRPPVEAAVALSDPAERLARHQRRLDRSGFPAKSRLRDGAEHIIHLEPALPATPPVSIIIPTNGSQREIDGRPTVLCLQAIDSVIENTSYPDYELVLVVTPGAPTDLATQVVSTIDSHRPDRQPTVRFCRDDRRFNFSNACNRGAVAADGDYLVFLNDDTIIDSADWLQRMVMYASRPDIGAVGARLHYGNGRIQHAGIWTRGGHPSHRYERFPADHPGYLDSLVVPQNCLAVTGACLAVAADKFRQAGGFSPRFPSSFNDVDLCLKLDDLGYRTVVDPDVVLTHFEASSRDPKIDEWELALLHERWRSLIVDDPYDNPHHLAPESEEFPPPDPMVTEQKRLAGQVDFLPRIWPRTPLVVD